MRYRETSANFSNDPPTLFFPESPRKRIVLAHIAHVLTVLNEQTFDLWNGKFQQSQPLLCPALMHWPAGSKPIIDSIPSPNQ
jgi:hypothetical protein